MSSPRANANQSLYLGKILLHAWSEGLVREEIPATVLRQAFLPGVRQHLRAAYGWFLLEITAADIPTDGRPPRDCAALPDIPPGKAVAGELREFERLEREGWLQQLLAEESRNLSSPRSAANLAVGVTDAIEYELAASWARELENTLSRMRDSLDEY